MGCPLKSALMTARRGLTNRTVPPSARFPVGGETDSGEQRGGQTRVDSLITPLLISSYFQTHLRLKIPGRKQLSVLRSARSFRQDPPAV